MCIVFDIPFVLLFGNQSFAHVSGAPCDAVHKPFLDKKHDLLMVFYSMVHESGESFQFHRDGLYQVSRFAVPGHCEDEDMSHTPIDQLYAQVTIIDGVRWISRFLRSVV